MREQANRLAGHIADLERRIDAALGSSPVAPLVGAVDMQYAWDRLSLLARRAVIATLLVAYIEGAGKGVRFDPRQVRIEWRAG